MSNTRSLSALSNEALASIAATVGSPIAEAILVERNRGLILSTARRYGRRLEVDDAFGVAAYGFVVGARKFDPSKGFRLTTLVVVWMRQALARYQAANGGAIGANERVIKDAADVKRAREMLGQGASEQEIAKALGITAYRVRAATSWANMQSPLSLDAPIQHGEADTFADLIGGSSAESEVLKNIAPEWLDCLTARERDIVIAHAFEEKTSTEIAAQLGISRERVRQIFVAARGKVCSARAQRG